MKNDIILSGVVGQGIISIASIIGLAAMENDLCLKQSEIHGMSQRGGAVQSHLRISDSPVWSDLIPLGKADMIISVEPMEGLRYLRWLKPEGWLVTSSEPYVNINDYPPAELILKEIGNVKNHIIVDAGSVAKETGSVRSGNMVLLGAASPFINMPLRSLENGVRKLFANKGKEVIEINLRALNAGREITAQHTSNS